MLGKSRGQSRRLPYLLPDQEGSTNLRGYESNQNTQQGIPAEEPNSSKLKFQLCHLHTFGR